MSFLSLDDDFLYFRGSFEYELKVVLDVKVGGFFVVGVDDIFFASLPTGFDVDSGGGEAIRTSDCGVANGVRIVSTLDGLDTKSVLSHRKSFKRCC